MAVYQPRIVRWNALAAVCCKTRESVAAGEVRGEVIAGRDGPWPHHLVAGKERPSPSLPPRPEIQRMNHLQEKKTGAKPASLASCCCCCCCTNHPSEFKAKSLPKRERESRQLHPDSSLHSPSLSSEIHKTSPLCCTPSCLARAVRPFSHSLRFN